MEHQKGNVIKPARDLTAEGAPLRMRLIDNDSEPARHCTTSSSPASTHHGTKHIVFRPD